MTPEQFRMAKAALGLTNPELAEKTGLHRNTLNKLDQGAGKASTIQLVRLTLEAAGIQFLSDGEVAIGPGVALRERPAPASDAAEATD
jgi:DNA-binding XRE family transcriptional regulator